MASGCCLVATSATAITSTPEQIGGRASATAAATAVEVLQLAAAAASGAAAAALGFVDVKTDPTCPTKQQQQAAASSVVDASKLQQQQRQQQQLQQRKQKPEQQLQLCGGASMIPHPEKAFRGGEDALFLHDSGMGVADGVGSWVLQGIDAGLFARSLMLESKKALDAGMTDPRTIMQRAHDATKARGLRGSSTALVLVLVDNVLHSANIGDSSYMIIRGGKVHHKEEEQIHTFNTPYQLGHDSAGADRASAAVLSSIVLQPGDVIIAGTDGLFDNLYTSRIIELVAEAFPSSAVETATTLAHIPSPGRGEDTVMMQEEKKEKKEEQQHQQQQMYSNEELGEKVQELAERLVEEAHAAAGDKRARVPFGDAAAKHGLLWSGGKMDDITACVSFVLRSSSS